MKYIVPDGCYFRSVAGVEFHAGEKLPENYRLKKGDMLLSQDYCYDYLGRNTGGWHISVKDPRKEEYENILSDIAGKPVINMSYTFEGCTSLTTAPTIPSSVTNMSRTFYNCWSLTTVPDLPDGLIDMYSTFRGCTSLTAAPAIPDGVVDMTYTFQDCSSLKEPPVIPEGVISMNFAFEGCSSLEEKPELPSTVENADGIFEGTPFDKNQDISEPEIDASEPEQNEEER